MQMFMSSVLVALLITGCVHRPHFVRQMPKHVIEETKRYDWGFNP